MQIIDILYKQKCDFAGCKNMAQFEIKDKQDAKKKMAFCKDCLQNIANVYMQATIPKQPKSPFKKQIKMR